MKKLIRFAASIAAKYPQSMRLLFCLISLVPGLEPRLRLMIYKHRTGRELKSIEPIITLSPRATEIYEKLKLAIERHHHKGM